MAHLIEQRQGFTLQDTDCVRLLSGLYHVAMMKHDDPPSFDSVHTGVFFQCSNCVTKYNLLTTQCIALTHYDDADDEESIGRAVHPNTDFLGLWCLQVLASIRAQI